jgi:hypothetical protein
MTENQTNQERKNMSTKEIKQWIEQERGFSWGIPETIPSLKIKPTKRKNMSIKEIKQLIEIKKKRLLELVETYDSADGCWVQRYGRCEGYLEALQDMLTKKAAGRK